MEEDDAQSCSTYKKAKADTGQCCFIEGPPKTEAGERSIHLPGNIVEMLLQHRKQQLEIQENAQYWEKHDLVFCTRNGNYIQPNNLRYMFDRLLEKAKLEHMKFHALRHNASLILRRLRIDPIVRMQMLGHSSLVVTDIVYGHTTPDMHEEAARELDHTLHRQAEEKREN